MTKVLLTGAGGFAGHHFLEHVLANTTWDVLATDSFRHKGTSDRIADVLASEPEFLFIPWRSRVKTITHDLNAPFTYRQADAMGQVDYMVCYASESHVDRSIDDPVPFVLNNTNIVLNTLELARMLRPRAVIWVSTDEVYGPVAKTDLDGHDEWAPILPSNPYAASKAAQEAIAISYWRTYGTPVQIVNCMNMIGERQDTEKFVPMVISKILRGDQITIHGTEQHIGTRHYLHARNLADAILFMLENQSPAMFPAHVYKYLPVGDAPNTYFSADKPDRWNVSSHARVSNLALVHKIAAIMNKAVRYRFEDFHSTRPGHDPHYGLNGRKLRNIGWTEPIAFDESLRRTVEWSLHHTEWL